MKDEIIAGDSLQVLTAMPDHCVDMVFADPPYNMQLNKDLRRPDNSCVAGVFDDWDKFDTFADYDRWSAAWLREARRVLKPDGTLWVMGSYHNIFRIGALVQSLDFWILNDIIWRKTNPMPNFRGTRFTNAHETLIWAAKSAKSKYTFNYAAMKTFNDDLQMRSDDWVFPLCTGKERLKNEKGDKLHSTQKPLGLVARAIIAATQPGDIVLDPFLGTGTTAVAARSLGRHYIGIEREAAYLAAAKQRVAKTKKLADEDLAFITPAKKEPRVPFGLLVEQGLIKPGAKLYDSAQKFSARVRIDGSLASGTLTGSIHSLAANLLQRDSCNGWVFWHYQAKKQSLLPIDSLRQKMRTKLSA